MNVTAVNHTITVRVVKIGEQDHAVLSSNDVWYRYLEGLAGLFIAWEIDADVLDAQAMACRADVDHRGDAAARALARHICLAMIEPDCSCDPYRTQPCACEPMNRRRRLAELMGVPYIDPQGAAAAEGDQ